MPTPTPDHAQQPAPPVDYAAAEGLDQAPAVLVEITAADLRRDRARREWLMVGLGLSGLVTVLAIVLAVLAFTEGGEPSPARPAAAPAKPPTAPTAEATAPTLADAKGIAFEKFEKVDATLPPVPSGAVKKFKVDVFHHVTQVSKTLRRRRSGASR
jgi:hypothetical protein